MPDSANILSILASLSGNMTPPADPAPTAPYYPAAPPQAPENVLQTAAPVDAFTPPASIPQTHDLAAMVPALPEISAAPRRRSLLDTIGRVADVFAKVGGADALYQPTLDARQDRSIAIDDHGRKVLKDNVDLATSQFALGDSQIARQKAQRTALGTALSAIDGHPEAASLWPQIAEQAGIDQQHTDAIGKILTANPAAAGILAKSLGADKDNLGKNVLFGTDSNGKTVAYQVGPDGNPHILDFGSLGITPSTPIKVIDTGGANVVVGSNGQPLKVLPKTTSPDTVANNATSTGNNIRTNETAVTVAGMPARSATGSTAAGSKNAAGISALQGLDESLAGLVTSPDLASATGLVEGKLNVTRAQRNIQGTIDSLEGQAIPAAIAAIKSSGGASPRAVSEIMGEVKGLVGAIRNRNMDTADYIANVQAARKRLRTRIQQLQDADAADAKAKTPVRPASVSGRPAAKAGWTIVGVK